VTSAAEQPRRAPLQQAALRAAVVAGSGLWSELRVVPSTGSTNEDLLAAARAGAPAGSVLVAEEQTRGRGRLDRTWLSQPGASLTFSVLLRPAAVPPGRRGWLPLLAGVAVAAGLRAEAGLAVSLKWPNDVQAGEAKLAGILAEQAGDAIVVGIGLNVSQDRAELPSDRATSLYLEGATGADRQAILPAVLREFESWYLRWAAGPHPGDADGSGLRAEYLRCCATVGRDVRVELPGGGVLAGRACDVDEVGQLLVSGPAGLQAVSAGDVVHVR
jgi:BirA family transcriptional regulator, biotin operon repressor / biotin---[acetyl-CoA-carboxylase] ligase